MLLGSLKLFLCLVRCGPISDLKVPRWYPEICMKATALTNKTMKFSLLPPPLENWINPGSPFLPFHQDHLIIAWSLLQLFTWCTFLRHLFWKITMIFVCIWNFVSFFLQCARYTKAKQKSYFYAYKNLNIYQLCVFNKNYLIIKYKHNLLTQRLYNGTNTTINNNIMTH